VTTSSPRPNQCQKPTGWFGRFVLRNMNSRHSKVTDWGLSHVSIQANDTVLDVGCGGGRTVGKLAAIATQGKVYGIDHSKESVAVAGKTNREWIALGRVEIREGSVSKLPFSQNVFDLVTAVETHFWWPNLPGDMREVFRVLKPGGMLVLIPEWLALRGAGWASLKADPGREKMVLGVPWSFRHPFGVPPYGDDPNDQAQIKSVSVLPEPLQRASIGTRGRLRRPMR